MMTIRNRADLRLAYSIARFVKDKNQKVYSALVKDIRNFNNDPGPAVKVTYFYDDLDGYYEKLVFPEGTTREEAENYFANECFMESPHSAYDCTGKCFTRWASTFTVNDRVVIYHRVARDV